MKLEFLYRIRFHFPESWLVTIGQGESLEGEGFYTVDGRVEGRINGKVTGANHPARRGDGTFRINVQGVIETDDGAAITFDHRGFGRTYPPQRRQIVVVGTHLSDDERYRWLNDGVTVGEGEVRLESGQVEIVTDWYEVGWEEIPE